MSLCSRRKLPRVPLALFLLTCCLQVWSQNNAASVSFILDFPGSVPGHYGINVASDGHASYVSDGKLSKDSNSDQDYSANFTISRALVDKIFDLAKQAHYFEGNLESKKKNIASTGDKTLMYKDARKDTITTYNYSSMTAVQEITSIFENLSATLEFGHRLDYDYHYQKLALDQDTKAMEEASGRGELIEIQAIAPTLQKIADDPSVINVVRARVEKLLGHEGAATKP